MPEANPLNQVYEAFWTMLEADTDFSALIPAKNRIKLYGTNNRYPYRDNVNEAGIPEVVVEPIKIEPQIWTTSDKSKVVATWVIRVATGDQRWTSLFNVMWDIYKALANWQATLQALTWNSKAFVVSCESVEAEQTVNNKDANRLIKGWATVWACTTEMWFDTTDLLPAEA